MGYRFASVTYITTLLLLFHLIGSFQLIGSRKLSFSGRRKLDAM